MKKAKKQLGKEYSVEVSVHSKAGDRKKYKGNAGADSGDVMKKTGVRFSKATEDTLQCGICIQKGADKGQSPDVRASCLTVKQKVSQWISKKEKEGGKKSPK